MSYVNTGASQSTRLLNIIGNMATSWTRKKKKVSINTEN